jgi:hypothetical protein
MALEKGEFDEFFLRIYKMRYKPLERDFDDYFKPHVKKLLNWAFGKDPVETKVPMIDPDADTNYAAERDPADTTEEEMIPLVLYPIEKLKNLKEVLVN